MESKTIREELEKLHPSAFGWAMVCCRRDRDLAADVLQQSYARILSGEAKYRGDSDFSTWVFGVIRFIALEEFRDRRREKIQAVDSNVYAQLAFESDSASTEDFELSEQLNRAMKQLSQRQRELIHLTFYEGMTIQQAADVLNIGVGSARQHYERGKRALRRILSASQEKDNGGR